MVVYTHLGRQVGLVVGRILDIVEQDMGADTSVVIHGRVTELVDVGELVGSLHELRAASAAIGPIGAFE